MNSSEDIEEAATVLRNINKSQGNKRTMKAGQMNSRKKQSLAKNQKEQESNKSDHEDSQSESDSQGNQGEQVKKRVANKENRTVIKKLKHLLKNLHTL